MTTKILAAPPITLAVVPFALVLALWTRTGLAQPDAAPPDPESTFAPAIAVQAEDYAVVRSRFHTKIEQSHPSPQNAPFPDLPAGATAVDFQSGGLRLKAWLNPVPTGDTNRHPAVLFLHGGFALLPNAWTVTQPYRDAGFIVLMPALCGENGQAGVFTLLYDEVDDVLAAAEYLRNQPGVDQEKLFLAGHSAGGILAMLAAETATIFKAAAPMSGSPDQLMLSRVTHSIAIPFDQNDPREFQVRSPLAYAGSFKCPTRIYYGTEEPIFDPTSRRTAELARARGLDVEAVKVPGDHHSSVPGAVKQSIEFFKRHF